MKYFDIIEYADASEICEWVRENTDDDVNPNLYVNTNDLNFEAPLVRIGKIYDDTKCALIKRDMVPLDEMDMSEWVLFDDLTYNHDLGLMWSRDTDTIPQT